MQTQPPLFDNLPSPPRPRRAPRDSAQKRKENGQFAAERKAGAAWFDAMLKALPRYLAELASKQIAPPDFTFEGFRMYCETKGLPAPASVNAWGALPSHAKRAGLCEWTGRVMSAIRPESHARLMRVWRPLVH
jgi:hypothetical protein